MSRKMEVVDYNPDWAKLYKEESKEIKRVLGKNCAGMYHIGSTAVKGMKARPIIDIMLVVKKLEKVEECIAALEELGYVYKVGEGIPESHFLMKVEDGIAFYVYIFEVIKKEERDKHVALRDYLIKYPEEAKAYGELKSKVVKRYAFDEKGYCKGKEAHLKDLMQKAVKWNGGQNDQATSIGMGVAFGACFGLSFGSNIWGSPGIGMCFGVAIGAALGVAMGAKKKND